MTTFSKLFLIGCFLLGIAWAAFGQTLYVHPSTSPVRANKLNDNLTAIKTAKVGAGVQLTNTDVASNAAIAHTKMATPALFPKAWTMINATCTAGTCTAGDGSQVTSTTFSATGVYNVTLAYTPGDANFAVIPTSHTAALYCAATGQATSAPHVVIRCYDNAGVATNASFSFIVMDT